MYHCHFDIVSFHYYSQISQTVSNSISVELKNVEAAPAVLLEAASKPLICGQAKITRRLKRVIIDRAKMCSTK